MTNTKTCSRPGCDKTLRDRNTTGMCASGCRSPEAPPSIRASSSRSAKAPSQAAAPERGALERFRVACDALGIDAEAELDAFAAAWLDGVKAKLAEGEA